MRIISAFLMTCLALPGLVSGSETSFPSKPIRIIAPFGAGGGGDTSLRMLAEHLGREVGQQVIVDNKPGGNGVIGVLEALRAPADGHTLFYGSTTTLAANASLMKDLPYDAEKDFAAIGQVGVIPFMLVTNPELPATSVQELIALAKAAPKPLTFASANRTGEVNGATFGRMAGIDLLNVPYKASTAALTDLIGGRVSMMFVDLAPGLPQVQAKRIRALAITTAGRSPLLPDLPTLDESGLKDFEIVGWTALAAPAGTPPAVIERLNSAINKILTNNELHAQFEKTGVGVMTRTSAETAAFISEEIQKWRELIRAAGISPE